MPIHVPHRNKVIFLTLLPLSLIVIYEVYKNPIFQVKSAHYDIEDNLKRNVPNLRNDNGVFQNSIDNFESQRSFESGKKSSSLKDIKHSFFDTYMKNKASSQYKGYSKPKLETRPKVEIKVTTSKTPTTSASTEGDEKQPPLFKATWINKTATFHERLQVYNKEISKIRQEIIKSRGQSNWTDVASDINVFWCNQHDALKKLEKFSEVKTVALSWDVGEKKSPTWSSLEDTSNLPLQVFYPWTASSMLCVLIQTPAYTKARWDAVYDKKCTTDLNQTNIPMSLEPLYFHGRPINRQHFWPHNGLSYPEYFYHSIPHQVFYMHIIQDGIITGLGDVISGQLKLLPYSCSQDTDPRPPSGYTQTPVYDEVFITTQHWGDQFFHKMLEVIPRIAPYVEFLQENPEIKIHVAELGGYTEKALNFLGFKSARFVTGICRSKVIYLPQATPCGFAQAQSTQYLSYLYRKKMDETMEKQERKSIILIRRSGSRRLTEQKRFERTLSALAEEFGMKYELFADNPSPTMEVAMLMFRRAVLIVGPHGAGLSNMIYSQPGTYVIEGVCNPPHVNMCFQWAAHILGHHYHGISSRRGCEDVVDIDASEVEHVARHFLKSYFKQI